MEMQDSFNLSSLISNEPIHSWRCNPLPTKPHATQTKTHFGCSKAHSSHKWTMCFQTEPSSRASAEQSLGNFWDKIEFSDKLRRNAVSLEGDKVKSLGMDKWFGPEMHHNQNKLNICVSFIYSAAPMSLLF